MSDETITQAEREMLIGRHKGGSKAADDIRWLLAALAEAEKRAEEAEQAVEELTPVVLAAPAVQRMVEDGAREAAQLRAALARLQPLIDVARAYAAVPGDRFASPEEDDLRGAALALFPEEVRRG